MHLPIGPILNLDITFRCIGPSQDVMCLQLGEIPSGRGEGPSYLKVPYICFPYNVISSHICTLLGVGSV